MVPAAPAPMPPTDLDLWPLAGLRAVSGDLELRYADDATLFALARLAAEGVHAPEAMPFSVPWTRGTPSEVARSVLRYGWGVRSEFGPEKFALELACVHRGTGEVLGVQAANGRDFAISRTVETGSWLGLRHQGRGIGTRMRRMMLHLVFEGLGARIATTSAFADNAASNGVTRAIGYEPNGVTVMVREGRAADHIDYRLTREAWAAQPDRPEVELHGVEAVRGFLGLD